MNNNRCKFPPPPPPSPPHNLHPPLSTPLQGVAINFVKNEDIKILRDIEQYYSTQVGAAGGVAAAGMLEVGGWGAGRVLEGCGSAGGAVQQVLLLWGGSGTASFAEWMALLRELTSPCPPPPTAAAAD